MYEVYCAILVFLTWQSLSTSDEVPGHMVNEKEIIDKILAPPNSRILMPIQRAGEPVLIKFYGRLIRIIDINEREQYIKVYMWLRMHWTHPLMTWNASEYGEQESVQVSTEDIWLPDIVMYNSVDTEDRSSSELDAYQASITVHSDGTVVWMKPVILRSTCMLDVSHFPFDDQECHLKFGSWTKDVRYVDMIGMERELELSYLPNGQWRLMKLRVESNVIKYTCCSEKFADVTVIINVRRETASYIINIIVPSALLSGLVLLTFVLPPESGERVSLCITVLLALTVFQELTAQKMPEFGLPYLAQYYFATLIVTAISLAVNTIILNIYHRSTRRTPKFIRKFIIDGLGSLLFCSPRTTKDDLCMENTAVAKTQDPNRKYPDSQKSDQNVKNEFESSTDEAELKARKRSSLFRVRTISISQVHPLSQTTESPDTILESRFEEWLKVVQVLDRLFLILFCIIMIVAFLAVFLRAPRFLGK